MNESKGDYGILVDAVLDDVEKDIVTPAGYSFSRTKFGEDDLPASFIDSYTDRLYKFRKWVIGFWVVVLLGTGYFAPQLLNNTKLTFTPPSTSPAAAATRALEKYCPKQANTSNIVILVKTLDNTDIRLSGSAKGFSFALNTSLYNLYGPDYLWGIQGYFLLEAESQLLTSIAEELLEHDPTTGGLADPPTSMIIVVSTKDKVTSKSSIKFADKLRKNVKVLASVTSGADNSAAGAISVTLTGLPALYSGIMASTISNLETMDAIVVPFAMVILAGILRSFRFLTISLFSLTVSFVFTFAVVDWAALGGLQILTAAPSLMGSILLAMSIDYSLFFFTRFQFELCSARLEMNSYEAYPQLSLPRLQLAVANVLRSSGTIIVASGSTLTICFLGLLFLPLNLIQTIGVSCAVALVITMAVTLTLCPAMLFVFPAFFTKSCLPPGDGRRRNVAGRDRRASSGRSSPFIGKHAGNANQEPELSGRSSAIAALLLTHKKTVWYKIGLATQHPVGSILILLISAACIYPLAINAFDPTLSTTLKGYLPRGGQDMKTLSELSVEYTPGMVYPYSVVMYVKDEARYGGTYVLSDDFIEATQDMVADWMDESKSIVPPRSHVQSIMYIDGIKLPPQTIRGALFHNCSSSDYTCPLIEGLMGKYASQLLNDQYTAVIVQIELGVAPFGTEGRAWVERFRTMLDKDSERLGIGMEMSGFGSDVADSVKYVYAAWPKMILIVTSIVLVMVGVTFRSLALAVRGCLTIGMTILFVQGLAKITYCDNYFGGLGFASISSTDGLIWLVPPTVFPLLVGIALDYDIFFIARIVEFRTQGLSTRDSILAGISETGTIITAAGIIQALAFFGLLVGDIPVLNQLSFYLLFGVLFDTFFIRTLVVPSIMYWLGDFNWWPMDSCAKNHRGGGIR
jgi:uncharacterized membrane protein YdfJ with MMPL/SSD domain